ncbi:MAG: glycosyltransferase [Gammaproteobacteria bacterium]|nr:glycosyltransferase [Gammaproteobacteria bacterium]MCY4211791.1 glycosyltransferase [Gammaproteobacteria bacterium]MCY4283385.1 glycosyltransferase [Gammaproteobacteria bacterium]MCY4338654.1 glycosyltransferase [Gammaproteobacteria bacterium]
MTPMGYSLILQGPDRHKMKICVIMLAKRFGGAERFFVDLTNGLARRGHEVLAISNIRSNAAKRLEARHNLKREAVRALGPWDLLAARKILRLVKEFAPDIMQTSLGRAAHLAGAAAQQLDIPLVAHTHDFVDLKYFRQTRVFTPTTRAQRDYLAQQGIAAERIRLIPNFSSFPAVGGVHCRPTVTKIVAHGRFVQKKGFDLLLRSFSRVAGADMRLYIAGDGTERRRLTQLAARLNLGERVCFVGWQDDIRSFLLQGDLFVLPSRYEPFGIAVLEAMACGVPIIATRCHGPVEILAEDSAWLCDAEQESLTAALQAAIDDPEGRARRAQAAWMAFRERYAEAQVVPRFEGLYESLPPARRP